MWRNARDYSSFVTVELRNDYTQNIFHPNQDVNKALLKYELQASLLSAALPKASVNTWKHIGYNLHLYEVISMNSAYVSLLKIEPGGSF